ADDRVGLAVAARAGAGPAAARGAAEHRRNDADAGLSCRDDRLWRGVAGGGAAVFGWPPRSGDRRAPRARGVAVVFAVLDRPDATHHEPDRRPARGHLWAAPRLSANPTDYRSALAEYALCRDRAGIIAADDPRARPGIDQPIAR